MSQIQEIQINDEYFDLIPRPTKEERQILKESIRVEGQQLPIIINPQYEILDGHTRYEICLELGIEPKYEVRRFGSKDEEFSFVINTNLIRRQLTPFQKIELIYDYFERVTKQNIANRHRFSNKKISGEKYRDIFAKKIGIGHVTFSQGIYILRYGSERIKSLVRTNHTTIATAYFSIKEKKKVKTLKWNNLTFIKVQTFFKNDPVISEQLETIFKKYMELKK